MRVSLGLLLALLLALALPGCSWARDKRRATELEAQLQQAQRQLAEAQNSHDSLERELQRAREQNSRERDQKEQQAQELVEAQRRLAESLKKELGEARAKLAMTERGLVLTFLDEIFFDSGKAVIKEEGKEALGKVARVLQETVPDAPVAVEGHTDNEPIKYSGWLSNWELSSGRALAVVHYFIESQSLAPSRIRAVGFGQFHPVASNESPEGRRQNRRVEVVILPSALRKVRE